MTRWYWRFGSHALVGAGFLVMAAVWTWPLLLNFTSDIPGSPGDNFAFLWNDWWMRTALASGGSPFHTDLLFAPSGIDLALHTHTVLSSWVAATVFGRLPVVLAHNTVILLTLALNGFAAYLLAWDRLRDRPSAIVAGLIFGGSPYLAAHLLGHVNLLSAWGLPLFALLLLRSVERDSWLAVAGAAIVVVLTAYNDYYYVVYCAVLVVSLVAFNRWQVAWHRGALPRGVRTALVALLVVDLALVMAIVASGGFNAEWLGVRIAANRPTNLLGIGWLLLTILLLGRFRPRLSGPAEDGHDSSSESAPMRYAASAFNRNAAAKLAAMAGLIAVGISPLLLRAWALIAAGDYTTPRVSWRSSPGGIDLATLALGNPWHGWLGASIRRVYHGLGIGDVENVGWLGVAPVALALWALTWHRGRREVRLWRWIGAVFFVWALGPWLRIAGVDTGLLLPQNLLAHVPIVANARMPGRAMVVVFLALAMLAAVALSTIRRQRSLAIALTAMAVAADFVPAPFPHTRVETAAFYSTLLGLPAGTVCELPMGVRDGFGMVGAFDDRALVAQMTHGHPIVGGFAARVPASIVTMYRQMPVVRSLLLLSEGKPPDPEDAMLSAADAGAALKRVTISYVVLNRSAALPALVDYVERRLPLKLLATEGEREFYAVVGGVRADGAP